MSPIAPGLNKSVPEEDTWLPGALCANNFSRTHTEEKDPCVCVGARKSEMQTEERHTLHSEMNAQGQGKTRSGVAATSAARIQGRVLSSAFMHPW